MTKPLSECSYEARLLSTYLGSRPETMGQLKDKAPDYHQHIFKTRYMNELKRAGHAKSRLHENASRLLYTRIEVNEPETASSDRQS